MPSSFLKVSLYPWAPGLSVLGPGAIVDPGKYALVMDNAAPTADGRTVTRPGYVRMRTFGGATGVAGLSRFMVSADPLDEALVASVDYPTYQDHIVHRGGRIYKFSTDAVTSTPGAIPDYQDFRYELFVASGGSMMSWSAKSGAANEPMIPVGSYLSSHNSSLLVGCLDDGPDQIAFSSANAPRNYTDVGVGGRLHIQGGTVTGLSGSYFGNIFVYTRSSFTRIQGIPILTDIQAEVVSRSIGLWGRHTLCSVENDLIWASERGLHSLQTTQKYGDVEETFLSAPIRNLWKRIVPYLGTAWAEYWPEAELYVLSVEMGSSMAAPSSRTRQMLCLHVPSGRWSGPWDCPAGPLTMLRLFNVPEPALVTGCVESGAVQAGYFSWWNAFDITDADPKGLNEGAFTRTPFTMRVTPAWINAGDPDTTKNWRRATVHFRCGAADNGTLLFKEGTKTVTTDTFYLNPYNQMPVLGNDTGPDLDGFSLGDLDSSPTTKTVELAGNAVSALPTVQVDQGHKFELAGLELFYLPHGDSPCYSGTETETVIRPGIPGLGAGIGEPAEAGVTGPPEGPGIGVPLEEGVM